MLDIDLAVEAGYPTELIYKLYIRQCKCLLELGKISEAQAAFDRAIDAIDRSGMKKDARKGMAANLQEAFINLAKSVEENPPPPTDDELQNVSTISLNSFQYLEKLQLIARRKLWINQTHEYTFSNFSPFRNGQN